MPFDGTEGAPISIEDAHKLTKNFRDHYPLQAPAQFLGIDLLIKIIEQEGTMGIRIYNGLDTDGKIKPIIVAAYANEDDNLALLGNNTLACPPRCASANPLNSD